MNYNNTIVMELKKQYAVRPLYYGLLKLQNYLLCSHIRKGIINNFTRMAVLLINKYRAAFLWHMSKICRISKQYH